MTKLLLLSLSLIALPAFGDPYKKIDLTYTAQTELTVEENEVFEICGSQGNSPFHWEIYEIPENFKILSSREENDARVWTIIPQNVGTFKVVISRNENVHDAEGFLDENYIEDRSIKVVVKPKTPDYEPLRINYYRSWSQYP